MRGKAQIEAAAREAESLSEYNDMFNMKHVYLAIDFYYTNVLAGEPKEVRRSLGRLLRTVARVAGLSTNGLMILVQEAANRNAHKGDWRRGSLGSLFDKLAEEVREFEEALDRSEAGDLGWTAVMIADHGLMLDLEEEGVA